MYKVLLRKQIDNYIDEYTDFVGIQNFPAYDLQFKAVSKSKADNQGYEVLACTSYQAEIQKHILEVSTNVELSKHLMFHEFTHMMDSELYVNGDKYRYVGVSGYTEYHASQVELMLLLGANAINDIPTFSIDTIIYTFMGKMSVA